MMPLDLPPERDRHRPLHPEAAAPASTGSPRARESYAFDMGSAVRKALSDLKLERGRVAFDDMGFGFRLGLEGARGGRRLRSADVRARHQDRRRDAPPGARHAAERGRDQAHRRGLGQGRHLARSEPGLCARGDRARRLRARSRRHGLGPSARRRSDPHAADRPRGRRGRARHPRHVRLPRHPRSVLLGRRQDLGGRRRARGRGEAVRQGDGGGRRGAARTPCGRAPG